MQKRIPLFIKLTVLLVISVCSVPAMALQSGDTVFTTRVKNTTCSITVPKSVDMASLAADPAESLPPFAVDVDCGSSTAKSYLWARLTKGTLLNRTQVQMVTDGGTDSAILTLFQDNGSSVVLNGDGEINVNDGFCSGDKSRKCSIKPWPVGISMMPVGETARAAVRFTLAYI